MTIDNLLKRQWGKLSSSFFNEGDINNALNSISKHYAQYEMLEDPIIKKAFYQIQAGAQSGELERAIAQAREGDQSLLSEYGLITSMNFYGGVYDDELVNSKISDIVESSNYTLPEVANEFIQNYNDVYYRDIIERFQANQSNLELGKAIRTIQGVESYKFDVVLKPMLIKESIDHSLEAMFNSQE